MITIPDRQVYLTDRPDLACATSAQLAAIMSTACTPSTAQASLRGNRSAAYATAGRGPALLVPAAWLSHLDGRTQRCGPSTPLGGAPHGGALRQAGLRAV